MFSRISIALAVAVAGFAGLTANSASANDTCGRGISQGHRVLVNHHNDYDYGHGYDDYGHYDDYDCHAPRYKTVLTWKYKRIAYKKKFISYDHCGEPYVVWKTYWKTVRVPVYRKVLIGY